MAFSIRRLLGFKPKQIKSIADLYVARELDRDIALAHEAILKQLFFREQQVDSESLAARLPREWRLRSANIVRQALNELWQAGIVKIRVKGKYPKEKQLHSIEPHYRTHVEQHLAAKGIRLTSNK